MSAMEQSPAKKRLVVHLGYHKTGSSSLQRWLLDHSEQLSEHMACYNLADGSSNPLKFAAHSLTMGLIGPAKFRERADEWAAAFRDVPQSVICVTDEGLPGLPLGSLTQHYRETGIYPRAPEIVRIMAEAFAEFDPVFVVFEREAEPWLKSVHNQMFKQGCLSEDYWSFIDKYSPDVNWPAFRARLEEAVEAGSGGSGRLVACSFEEEFAKPAVAEMTLFKELGVPLDILARCRPQLTHVNASMPLEARPPERLPAMVLGGPNSILAGGWVNLLRRNFDSLVDITNLSLGASTTAMGLYRLLSWAKRPPEAAVFWEYGINEYNHHSDGQSLESLLYHVEWLIQVCIRERRPLVPVLMRNCAQLNLMDDPYIPALKRLFAAYQVPVLDVQQLLPVLARGQYKPAEWYSENSRYRVDTELPMRIAEHVMVLHRQARPPVQNPERARHFDPLNLHVTIPNDNAPSATFKGNQIAVSYEPFGLTPRVSGSGRALAAIIVTSGSGPAIEIETGAGEALPPVSTQIAFGEGIPPRQLRQLVLSSDTREIDMQGELIFRTVEPETWPETQSLFCWQMPAAEEPDALEGNGLVAVIYEQPRG